MKMVSVRTADNTVSREPDDVLRACEADPTAKLYIGAIEKKVRNLEKRKTKLDGYKQKIASGERLIKEQMDALDKYESVSSNLDFAREIQKQIQNVAVEVATENSQERRNNKSKHATSSLSRELPEIVMLQSVLRGMKRSTTLNCPNGFTPEDVMSLLEFGDLISCSDDLSEFQIQTVVGHLCKYVSKDDEAIAGTTYGHLHTTVHRYIQGARMSSTEIGLETTKSCLVDHRNNKSFDSETSSESIGSVSPTPQVNESVIGVCNKPLQDILKDMEGEFTFLQESEIYKEEVTPTVEAQIENLEVSLPTNSIACMAAVTQNSYPIDNAVFMPKFLTIPITSPIYAPSNTPIPLTHQYTVPPFTSYDYTIQSPMPFQAVYHHAIINGTTYFHQPGAMFATQTAPDSYAVTQQIEEYTEPPEMNTATEVYYPTQYDLPIQPPSFPPQAEEHPQENFETPAESDSDLSQIPPQLLSDPDPTKSLQTPQNWGQFRGRGGRGIYRGPRNFQNQNRYQRSRQDSDHSSGYRSQQLRSQRYNNSYNNAFQQNKKE